MLLGCSVVHSLMTDDGEVAWHLLVSEFHSLRARISGVGIETPFQNYTVLLKILNTIVRVVYVPLHRSIRIEF